MFFNLKLNQVPPQVTSIDINESKVYLTTNGKEAALHIRNRLYGYQYASAVDGGPTINFSYQLERETITLQGDDKMLAVVFYLLKEAKLLSQQSITQLAQHGDRYSSSFIKPAIGCQ
jgi:hypothetical protein